MKLPGNGELIAELLAAVGAIFIAVTQVAQMLNQAELARIARRSNKRFDESLDNISNMILALKSDRRENRDEKK